MILPPARRENALPEPPLDERMTTRSEAERGSLDRTASRALQRRTRALATISESISHSPTQLEDMVPDSGEKSSVRENGLRVERITYSTKGRVN
jgi:hypothetical protein